MESFFALLWKDALHRKRRRTREELRIAIITWSERTYHRRRRQARLGRFPGSSRFVVNDPAVAGIHATVFAALVSRIRIR